MKVAAKLLSRVEVEVAASNQHEFNATLLWRALEFPRERVSGTVEMLYLGRDVHEEPLEETFNFTLYDSREGQPRPPEYRLYFDSPFLQARSQVGDTLILIRQERANDLKGLIIDGGSELGVAMATLLRENGVELETRFKAVTTLLPASALATLLEASGGSAETPGYAEFLAGADQSFLKTVLESGDLPSAKVMANEAQRAVRKLHPGVLNPDDELHWGLQAETALFLHLEEQIGQRRLDRMTASGTLSFADATSLVRSQLQSRKSRRGQSLQNHFEALLVGRQIPFGAQCRIARGETPDFLIPGCSQYLDPAFPPGRLRMVACKTTLKERWAQVLKEADRIPDKFVLTLDPSLTDDVVDRMSESRLSVFLPEPVLRTSYVGRKAGKALGTVSDLINQLDGCWLQ